MYSVKLVNLSRELNRPLTLNVCDTFFSRFRGFMLSKGVKPTEGLLFVGQQETVASSSIHMFFVNFPLGVIWMDTEKRITDMKVAKPWRPYYAPRAASLFILETHPDRLADFAIGDQLDFENA